MTIRPENSPKKSILFAQFLHILEVSLESTANRDRSDPTGTTANPNMEEQMKNQALIVTLLFAALAAAAPATALAFERGCDDCRCDRMERRGERPDGDGAAADEAPPAGQRLQRMARILDLSDVQQEKIRVLVEEEQDRSAELREKMRENRRQLRHAEEKAPFDEKAVRALAAKQSELLTEQIVSRAKLRNQMDAILTPEQRKLLERMRPEEGEGRGPGRRGPRD
jgi:Spy/CpxP family protein refolding chaperone